MKHPEKNSLLDASCFFLLEVTADSDDAGAEDGDHPFDLCLYSAHRETEEDAESCSYDDDDEVAMSGDLDAGSEINSLKIEDFMEDDNDHYDYDDEREDGGCGKKQRIGEIWRDGDVNQSDSALQISYLSGESGLEMDEMERSRRFWEHCLAS